MKKKIQIVIYVFILTLIFSLVESEAGTRVYVRIAPPKARVVKVARPVRPLRSAVWVTAHYRFKNDRYVWVSGRWIKHRHGYIYVQPGWKKHKSGYYYTPGCWVKK